MASKPANAVQKKWMSDIAEFINEESLGILYPDYEGDIRFELHHVLGRSAKHNKVSIGHEFIIPVPKELHEIKSNHPNNVSYFKKNFVKAHGDQRGIFQCLISCMAQWGYETPDMDIYNAIMDTNV